MGLLTRDAFFFTGSGCWSAGLRASIVQGVQEDPYDPTQSGRSQRGEGSIMRPEMSPGSPSGNREEN